MKTPSLKSAILTIAILGSLTAFGQTDTNLTNQWWISKKAEAQLGFINQESFLKEPQFITNVSFYNESTNIWLQVTTKDTNGWWNQTNVEIHSDSKPVVTKSTNGTWIVRFKK